MPELPEVETVMRGLEPAMTGQRIAKVEQNRANLRYPFPKRFVQRLTDRTIVGLRRRAKYILIDLDDDQTLIVHLGMTGKFTIEPNGKSEADQSHEHVVFHIQKGARIGYSDPRRFGLMDLAPTTTLNDHVFFQEMGIEPLGNELSPSYLNGKFAGRKAPIKAALLDQKIIAGLGNIYVCEALYRAGISPRRMAKSVRGKRVERLVPVIREILYEAIEAGGSTLKDFAHTDGELGYFQKAFDVYDREGDQCHTKGCQALIHRIVQSNRSTFYCPKCQR